MRLDDEGLVILKALRMRKRRRAGSYILTNSAAAMVATPSGELGLALIEQNGEIQYWGIVTPHYVVQFYRAMQLLDIVTVYEDWILSACYYVGARKPGEFGKDRIEFLEHNGVPDLRNIRKKIFRKPIPQEDIDEILEKADKNGISISGWELEDAVRAGDIRRSAMVMTFIHREEVERSQIKIRDYLAKKLVPLSDEVSFEAFCKRVGLGNICDVPVGAYGFDWGHYRLAGLDEKIVRLSLDELPFYLFCSQCPEGYESFGAIGIPVFDTDDGRVALERVEYSNRAETMVFEAAPMSGECGDKIELPAFEAKHPKLVGVARYEDGHGYVVTEVELTLRKEPEEEPEKPNVMESVRQKMVRLRNRLGL